MPERVVFDTNVWISGLLWRGTPHQCILLARAGILRPVFCDSMVDELLAKLKDSFNFDEKDLLITQKEMADVGDRVEIPGDLRVVLSDPDDDKFLECALISNTPIVVSGDKHLLRLESFRGVRVLSPRDYLRYLGGL